MKPEKVVKYVSVFVLLAITLAILPPTIALPAFALNTSNPPAEVSSAISTSRDSWGTVYKNMQFYVDVVSYTDAAANHENITITVTVGSVTKLVNASRIQYTPTYRANFTIDENGVLNYTSIYNVNITIATLQPGDEIEFSYGTLSKTLTYEHAPATATIRTSLPYPIYKVGTLDWVISAPDLNKNPYEADSINANITVKDYTTGHYFKIAGVPFVESDVNSGEFVPVSEITLITNGNTVNSTSNTPNGTVATLVNSVGQSNISGIYANVGRIFVNFSGTPTNNITTVTIEYINITGGPISNCNISPNMLVNYTYTITNITNKTPTKVEYEIPISNTSATFSVEYNITINASNIGYNASITKFNLSTNILDEYIFYAAGVPVDVNEDAEVWVSVPQYTGSTHTDTQTIPISVFRYIAQVSGTASLKDGLYINVKDNASNYKTYEAETVNAKVYIPDVNTTPIPVTLYESDVNTGVFEGSLPLLSYVPNEINGSYNLIKVSYTDTNNVVRNATIPVQYYKGEIVSTTPSSIIFGKSVVEIEVNDSDLNLDPYTRDSYQAYLHTNDPAVLNAWCCGTTLLANISLYAELSNGTDALLTVRPGVTSVPVSLTETGPDTGVFVIRFDLSKFEVKGIGTETAQALKIVYLDMFTPDLKPEESVAEIPAAVPSITVDRTEIPLTTFGSPVIHITVTDQEANANTYAEDTVKVGLYLEYANGTIRALTPNYTTLMETDVNTGVFEGSYSISTSNLQPALIGGKLLINYTTPDSHTYLQKEIPFKVYPVEIQVNGTSSVKAKYGDVVVITVKSNDFNLDASTAEEYNATELGITLSPGCAALPSSLTFKETGPNTGVFEATLPIDGSFAKPATTTTLSIEDKTPTYATFDMTSWPEPETVTASIYVESFTGNLTTDKNVSGPVGKITLTVTDPDQNKDLSSADSVTLTVQRWDGTYFSVTAYETDVSTGVFKYVLDVSQVGSPSAVIGHTIKVIYRDPVAADGNPRMSIVNISFISWDPNITTDKAYYNVGDKVNITITDPDANLDPNAPDNITVRVTSTSDPVGSAVTLLETGPNTGVFTGEVLLSNSIGPGRVYVKLGDVVTISYTDQYPADYGVTGEPKTFTYTVRVGVPVEKPIVASNMRFVDPWTGQEITPAVNKTVGIEVMLNNTGYMKYTFTALLIVRDSSGTAINIQWQTMTLPAGGTSEVGFTFTPTLSGNYTVNVYIIKSLSDWTPLGETLTSSMSVPA